MSKKKCKKCGSNKIKKDGRMRGKQRYKCSICGYVFQSRSHQVSGEILRRDYTWGKQTYAQLSERYRLSIPTIKKRLDQVIVKKKS